MKLAQRHRLIRLSTKDNICFFINDMLGKCSPLSLCWSKKTKIQVAYDEARKRLRRDLDIVKIISAVKNLKALIKASFATKKAFAEVAHSGKNVIALDSDSHSSEGESKYDEQQGRKWSKARSNTVSLKS